MGRSCSGGSSFSDEALTDREREVLELLADGKSAKEIAQIIEMSVKTVDARCRRVMQKLGIENIAELVKYAIRLGITTILMVTIAQAELFHDYLSLYMIVKVSLVVIDF